MTTRIDGFLPLRDYAVLGDGRTCALIGRDGDVDWWALPRMDADPSFGALLDPERGGRIRLRPRGELSATREYVDSGGVLAATFQTPDGRVRVTDSLNLSSGSPLPWSELARVVEALDGPVPMSWSVEPGDRFGTTTPYSRVVDGTPLITVGGQQLAVVTDGLGSPCEQRGHVGGEFVAHPGRPALLAVVTTDKEPTPCPSADAIRQRADETAHYWKLAADRIGYDGPWRDAVVRSALVQQQLTFAATGALQAAATTSLPESLGGKRNYDYRFCWVRDTAFALDALTRLELRPQVHATLSYLLHAVDGTAPEVRVCYTLDGLAPEPEVTRVQLWRGYRDSTPVRSGNQAASQRQLGIYGDLLETITHYVEHGNVLDSTTGQLVSQIADKISTQWLEPDAGLWELADEQQYTSSKLGCWAALDRAIRLAEAGHLPDDQVGRWRDMAETIRDYIESQCWSDEQGSYTAYAGTQDLDCASLLVARTHFCDGASARLSSTIDAVQRELSAGGPLLYRYSAVKGEEGAFVACSFWLVEALVHAGRVDEARRLMDEMVPLGNDLGLFSEEIDPQSLELLGNIPQSLSHLALIGAATSYQEAVTAGAGRR